SAMGTPAYMSPEAWQGVSLDARSDIYSLGAMLYEMITGDLPFHGDSPYKLLFAHVNEPPPRISQLPPEFSPQINQIVQQALAKSPSARPESAMPMASAFHAAVSSNKAWTPPESITLVPTSADTGTTQKSPAKPGETVAAPERSRWLPIVAAIAAF